MPRIIEYKKKWKEITDIHGALCFYCRKEVATTIDHVVPYSYDQDGDMDNLVPACLLCNAIASNKHFEDVWQKRQYIIRKRESKANRIVSCSDCLLPFSYRLHSPSLFICAECYDAEYRTKYSEREEWHMWLKQLRDAGIPAEAHRTVKNRLKNMSDISRKVRLETLVDEYSIVMGSDEVLLERLIRS